MGEQIKKTQLFFTALIMLLRQCRKVNKKQDQIGFLGIWKPRVENDVSVACFLSKILKSNNPMFNTTKLLHESLSEWTIEMGKHKNPQLDLLNNFLFDRFIYEKEPYALTSWISHQMMYTKLPDKPQTDGIVYPSIESSLRFCNYAFNPQFVDKFLVLDEIIQFTLELNKIGKGSFAVGKIGKLNKGKIDWRIPTQIEFQDFEELIYRGIK